MDGNFYVSGPVEPEDPLLRYSRITEARFFSDGDQWCAVFPDFVNLQESPVGFGKTQMDALVNLLMDTIERLKVNQKEPGEPDPLEFHPAAVEILNSMKEGDL